MLRQNAVFLAVSFLISWRIVADKGINMQIHKMYHEDAQAIINMKNSRKRNSFHKMLKYSPQVPWNGSLGELQN